MEKEIAQLTKTELLNPEFIPSIFEIYPDEKERQDILVQILDVAKREKVFTKVKTAIDRNVRSVKLTNNIVNAILIMNNQGETEASTENFVTIMETDDEIKDLFYYDEFINQPINKKTKVWWSDTDDSALRYNIEKKYGIYNVNKYYDAFNEVLMRRKVHPIKEIIEEDEWDGQPRIDLFLSNIMGCDRCEYTKEVSRMIFYGGINRLYNPGCKFDYMPILIGRQGTAKSSIVSWLALKDDYYKEVYTIDGKDGMELLDGAWICEMGELLAMVKSKEAESMKSYLTRCSDKYRKAYSRRLNIYPRSCIFIGTTNDDKFLNDKTGNRRYLPINVNSDGPTIYKNKEGIQTYILKCWREALYLYKTGKTYLTIPLELSHEVERRQAEAVVEDNITINISTYLEELPVGYQVSVVELWCKVMNKPRCDINTFFTNNVRRIMNSLPNWEKCERFFSQTYGQQRGWTKLYSMDYTQEGNVIKARKKPDVTLY